MKYKPIEYNFDLTDEQSKELESLLIKKGWSNRHPIKCKFYYVKYKQYPFSPIDENIPYKFIELHHYIGIPKPVANPVVRLDNTNDFFNDILNLITPLIREYKINNLMNE
jgi:hypothetical protein